MICLNSLNSKVLSGPEVFRSNGHLIVQDVDRNFLSLSEPLHAALPFLRSKSPRLQSSTYSFSSPPPSGCIFLLFLLFHFVLSCLIVSGLVYRLRYSSIILAFIFIFQTVFYTMSSSAHFDSSSFQEQSDNFISWLEASPGVNVNPKICLADLRSSGAGRGVGKSTHHPPHKIHSVDTKRSHGFDPLIGYFPQI